MRGAGVREARGAAYREVHAAAGKIEPRMARALKVAADRVRSRVPFRQIEEALWRRDARAARALLDAVDVEDAYLPSAEIVRGAVVTGGKVASR
jgi:hypothetical protein